MASSTPSSISSNLAGRRNSSARTWQVPWWSPLERCVAKSAHLVEGQLSVLDAALLGSPAPVKVVERGTVHLATRVLKPAALRYAASAVSED